MTDLRTTGHRLQPGMTVQRWFALVLVVMVVLVAVGTVVGARLLAQTNAASDLLIEHIQPARSDAYQLQAALVDQETGERGYALTADRQFLAPYHQGQTTERQAAQDIRRLLPDDATALADVQRLEDAAARWRRQYADPVVAGVHPGHARPLNKAAALDAKDDFDGLRRLFDAQNADLERSRDVSLAQLDHARSRRNLVLGALVVAFLVAGLLMTVLVRVGVIRPLEILRTSSRRVAAGEFDHPISENGPEDIRAVARDVDSMRRRIMAALESSRAQERLLTEQAASLDAQALELRRSNAELEQFAYVASHDLQEPLRKVASFCQLLEKRYGDTLDERGRQYIDFAVDGAKRMQVLITDLLTFSRVGRVEDAHEQVDLDALLDKALVNLAGAVEDSGVRIERPDRLPTITGAPTLLGMLFQNLLGNAIKFRAEGTAPVVSVACAPDPDQPDEGWLLSVTDNGIGIPAEFAEKVFVIFQRLHSRDNYGGTGIGLALCKKIVDHHGGRIWIDTSYTGGTRICFTLPTHSAPGRSNAPALDPMEGSTL